MPSTYTTNLGIEKIETGEQSGTWGTTTNTNLDLIDEAVNGVEQVTLSVAGSSGSPNDLAITNATSSDGRNKFIEFIDGGDLGGTAFVQLTPNDAEKVVFIRNSLSAARDITIFQGTYNASNDFVIPNGADVVLKFDGAGAGAVVSDVYVNLTPTKLTTAEADVTTGNITTVNATTVDTTNVEVTNLKANDGTSAGSIADSTGVVTLASSVLTTTDINGGTIDGTVIGGTTTAAGSFTTLQADTSLNVDGTVTADGLTVGDDQNINLNGGVDSFDVLLRDTTGNATIIRSRNNVRVNLDSNNDSTTTATFVVGYDGLDTTTKKAIEVKEGGDISFYEDTGNTAKLFWDASAESLGIGTTDPKSTLEVKGTFGAPATSGFASGFISRFSQSSGAGCLDVGFGDPYSWLQSRASNNYATNFDLALNPNGGNVGIGTDSPDTNLHIATDSGGEGILVKSTGDTSNAITVDSNRSGAGTAINQFTGKWNTTAVADIRFLTGSDTTNKDDGEIAFYTSSAGTLQERIRIARNGDISFYEDTGTTPKLFWDASAEGLSIGTTSNPNNAPLLIRCASDDNIRIKQETHASIQSVNDAADAFTELKLDGSSLLLNSQSLGNVGIGAASPAAKLEISSGANAGAIRVSEANHNNSSSTFRYTALSYWARQDNNRRTGTDPLATSGSTAAIVFTDEPGNSSFANAVRGSAIEFWTAQNFNGVSYGQYPIQRMKIDISGNLDMTNGGGNIIMANGAGIDFSATADGTGASNVNELLDDYEEGTWTPLLSDAGANTYTGSYSHQYGYYTRVGNTVTVHCYLVPTSDFTTNGLNGSLELRITGLPFPVNMSGAQGTSHLDSTGPNLSSGYTTFGTFARNSGSYVSMREMGDSQANSNMLISQFNISTGRQFQFTMTYQA